MTLASHRQLGKDLATIYEDETKAKAKTEARREVPVTSWRRRNSHTLEELRGGYRAIKPKAARAP